MLYLAPGVRNLFVGRKLAKMVGNIPRKFTAGTAFQVSADGWHIFQIPEIELGMMYDNLYTKATRQGWFEHGLGLYPVVSLTFHW